MIHTKAAELTTVLVNKKIIEEKSHDVYTYGFELIFSALINIFLIAVVSIAFRRYYDWLLFLAAFIPLRTMAGGYHAKSHAACIFVGTVSFALSLFVSSLHFNWTYAIYFIAAFSLLLILCLSPVEAENKKLKEKRRKICRRVSIYIGCFNLGLALTVNIIYGLSGIFGIYFAGVFAAALSMAAARTIYFKEGVQNEKD